MNFLNSLQFGIREMAMVQNKSSKGQCYFVLNRYNISVLGQFSVILENVSVQPRNNSCGADIIFEMAFIAPAGFKDVMNMICLI